MNNQYQSRNRQNTQNGRNNQGQQQNGRSNGYGQQGGGRQQGNNREEKSYFNHHVNAVGYLNGISERSGQNGTFYVLKFTALEGEVGSPNYHFYNLTVPSQDLLNLIMGYWNDVNDEQTKVFISCRLSGLSISPFEFDQTSKNAGQLGVVLGAKLINLQSLTINGQKIDLGGNQYQGDRTQSAGGNGYRQGSNSNYGNNSKQSQYPKSHAQPRNGGYRQNPRQDQGQDHSPQH